MSAQPASLQDLLELARSAGDRPTIACAAAHDSVVLEGIALASREGIARAVLIGDAARIRALAATLGLSLDDHRVLDVADPAEACHRAATLCRDGEAHAIMKGDVPTSTLLRAVLDPSVGVRGPGVLSHVAVFAPAGFGRLMLLADAGVNVAPNAGRKLEIIRNTVILAHALGIAIPRVALLAALEQTRAQMPATLEAAEVVRLGVTAGLPACRLGGPYSLDVAVSRDAAAQKGAADPVAGRADVLIAPDIEAGNVLYKSLTCFAGLPLASAVLGALAPLIVPSRADSSLTKLYSIALAAYAAGRRR